MLSDACLQCAQAADGAGSGIDPAFLNARVSQKFGADLSALDKRDAAKSGDADLPVKAPLHERRARLDSVGAAACSGSQAAPSPSAALHGSLRCAGY